MRIQNPTNANCSILLAQYSTTPRGICTPRVVHHWATPSHYATTSHSAALLFKWKGPSFYFLWDFFFLIVVQKEVIWMENNISRDLRLDDGIPLWQDVNGQTNMKQTRNRRPIWFSRWITTQHLWHNSLICFSICFSMLLKIAWINEIIIFKMTM